MSGRGAGRVTFLLGVGGRASLDAELKRGEEQVVKLRSLVIVVAVVAMAASACSSGSNASLRPTANAGPNQLIARGALTIKGITKEIELPITLLGVKDIPAEMQEMLGGVSQVASFEAKATLDRREFEVGVANWAQTVIVGGDVEISIALEANQK